VLQLPELHELQDFVELETFFSAPETPKTEKRAASLRLPHLGHFRLARSRAPKTSSSNSWLHLAQRNSLMGISNYNCATLECQGIDERRLPNDDRPMTGGRSEPVNRAARRVTG
jgi:hypothetical protein